MSHFAAPAMSGSAAGSRADPISSINAVVTIVRIMAEAPGHAVSHDCSMKPQTFPGLSPPPRRQNLP